MKEKIINKLAKVIPDRSIKLLNYLIRKNKFLTVYQIRFYDKRNAINLKRDLEHFYKYGLVLKRIIKTEIGIYKGKRGFENYKINLKNSLIKEIIKKCPN